MQCINLFDIIIHKFCVIFKKCNGVVLTASYIAYSFLMQKLSKYLLRTAVFPDKHLMIMSLTRIQNDVCIVTELQIPKLFITKLCTYLTL